MIATPAQAAVFWKIIGISLIALAALGVTSLVMKEYRLALFGERSSGVVKKVETITTSTASKWITRNGVKVSVPRGGDLTFMTIDFTTKDGKEVEVETLATFHTEAKKGDTHPMIYLPSHPENAKIYSAKQLWLPMCVGTVFSIGCLLAGLWLMSKGRKATPAQTNLSIAPIHVVQQAPQASRNTTPVIIPSIRELYHRDFTFGRSIKAAIGSVVAIAGIYWATRPIPGVEIEPSPERDAAPYIMMIAAAVGIIAAVVGVLRHGTISRTLRTGLQVAGKVDAVDMYERRTDDQTDMNHTRTYSRSYVATISYAFNGKPYCKRIRLPLSPSTYGATQGKEIDLLLLAEAPAKPLIRAVYLGKF